MPFTVNLMYVPSVLHEFSMLTITVAQVAVSIGLAYNKQSVLGVVYDPIRDECFKGTLPLEVSVSS
jgi:hypothetical protein